LNAQNKGFLRHLKSYDFENGELGDLSRSKNLVSSKKINSPLKKKSPVKGELY